MTLGFFARVELLLSISVKCDCNLQPTDTALRFRYFYARYGNYCYCSFIWRQTTHLIMKKRSERRKHCALAVVRRSQKISPRRRILSPRAQDGQNLTSWRWSLPSLTNPVCWRSMHAISSYRDNRPTYKQTSKQTHKQTGQITIHCAAKLIARSVMMLLPFVGL